MTKAQIAKMLDVTLVRNCNTIDEIDQLISTAKEHDYACVFAMQCFYDRVKAGLAGTDVHVGGIIGFPSGCGFTDMKLAEARKNVEIAADEVDMVINLSMMLSGKYDVVRDEIRAIKDILGETPLKCIIEMHTLGDDLAKKAAELVVEGGADYVKTGTGWFAPTTVEDVKMLKSVVGDSVYIKAAGGIRDLATVEAMAAEGAYRCGVGLSSALSILKEAEER